MKGLRSIVALPRESLRGLLPAKIVGRAPTIEWLDPRTLFVEESYQREVGVKGVRLIRHIYAHFSWARFKFPVCVRMAEFDDATVCIDGQHTAIAAACHPGLPEIPVMLVDAATAADRAGAFVGHNRDRVALTPVTIFHAELAAGDDIHVQQVFEACRRAGAKVLEKSINLRDKTPVGHTIAVGTLKNVAKRRGTDALTRILRVLVEAERGPIKAAEIQAVDAILAAGGKVPAIDGRLTVVIASKTPEAWAAMGATAAAASGEPLGSAIASAWLRELNLRVSAGPGPPVLLRPKGYESPPLVGPIDQKPGSSLVGNRPLPGSDLVEVPDLSDLPPELVAELLPARRPDSPFRTAPGPRRRVEPIDPPPKAAPVPKNVPAEPRQAPAPPPAPILPTKVSQPAPPPDSREIVARNGVTLDMATGELRHRGKLVRVHRADGIRAVAALLKVMPAILEPARVAAKAFPKDGPADGPQRVKLLIDDVNPVLRAARLEIRSVKPVGVMLADLG